VTVGSSAATGVSVGARQIAATVPALPAGKVHAVRVTNPDGRGGVLANGWLADFLDVSPAHPFHDFVESIVRAGITSGCGGGNYCPDSAVTRAQMAVFLLKTLLGSAYVPPAAVGVFEDVSPGSFAADWIEDLAARSITAGCSVSPSLYCPTNPNTRGQMAVFIVKTFRLP